MGQQLVSSITMIGFQLVDNEEKKTLSVVSGFHGEIQIMHTNPCEY